MQPTLSRHFSLIWLLLLLLAAVFIRVEGAEQYYYHPDEMMHIDIAKGETLTDVFRYSLYETHPPLGHFIRHYWLSLSDSLAFQRSLSLAFGLMIIILYYQIGCFIKDRFTGLCLATLATFSNGLLIQSYVIRNYTIFVFFISLSYYFYLRFRKSNSDKDLLYYFLTALLAITTHFSGIFAVFTIAAYETLDRVFVKKQKKSKWVIANFALAFIYLVLCYYWQGTNSALSFAAFKEAYIVKQKFSISDLLVSAAFYPMLASYYILPSKEWLEYCLGATVLAFILQKGQRYLMQIMLVSFAVGMLLVASGSYQFLTSRRSIWIAPFVLIAIGTAIAESLLLFVLYLTQKKPFYWLQASIMVLTLAGVASYNKETRFLETNVTGDTLEYNRISKGEQDKIADYIAHQDSKKAVILDRGKIFLFANVNPYSLFGTSSLQKGAFAVMPYNQTELVFAASYYGFDMLKNATFWQVIDNKETLIFLKSPFLDDFVDKIDKCKQVPREEIPFQTSTLLLFPKKAFYEDIIKTNGKYHSCID